MKTIMLALEVADDLYRHWARHPEEEAGLRMAITECMRRYYQPPDIDRRRPGNDRRHPQTGNPDWGQAHSRRWDDLATQRAALTERKSGTGMTGRGSAAYGEDRTSAPSPSADTQASAGKTDRPS
jgi:hypothetical protein